MSQVSIKADRIAEAKAKFLRKYPNEIIYNVTREHTRSAKKGERSYRVTGYPRMRKTKKG